MATPLPQPLPSAPEIELTVVMPCLDEARTLGACIAKAQRFFAEAGVAGEVVVADNGSTDGSREIAANLGARVVEVPLRGYGAALFEGCRQARGRFVVMGDADDSYDFSQLAGFLGKLRAGADLVMGNRFLGRIAPGAMPWKNRYLGNPVLSWIGRTLFGIAARDFHCGLRGFSREAFERMNLVTTGMEFASEMVIKASLLGFTVAEVPTNLDKDGRDRPPHLRPWRDGWRHLRFMLLYSPRWLFLYPGVAMMIAGGAASAVLVHGPVDVGYLVMDVHTLLYAASTFVIGYQLVAFSAFARILARREGLVPDEPGARRSPFLSFEYGLVIGAALALAGLAGSVVAVLAWRATGFGALEASRTMRLAIPSTTLAMVGFQTIFNGFFSSMLGLRTRRKPEPEVDRRAQ